MAEHRTDLLVPLAGAITLIAGFAVADATGNRPLGGAVLLLGGAGCAWAWRRSPGLLRAVAAVGVFAAAFALSHPLADVVGTWPSVLLVSGVAAAAARLLAVRGSAPERTRRAGAARRG